MRTTGLILSCLLALPLAAQTHISKTLPFQSGQKVKIRFDYPELIKVSTWDKNEVSIQGSVSINGGENDDAFKLETSTAGGTLSVSNEITNMSSLPHRITIVRSGQKITFRNKTEWRKYQNENGGGHEMMNEGVDMDIQLEIKVPHNVDTYVESVYGMVEIKDFTGPLRVQATYGGVDASITERNTGELVAETNYGHIYSNLDTKLSGNVQDEDFHTYVSLKPGNGPRYSFESQYGNVYLRKVN